MRKDIYESPLSSRYASEYMLHLFSPDMRFQTWRRLWVALARAEHELGLPITQEQVDELAAHITDIDYEVAEKREHYELNGEQTDDFPFPVLLQDAKPVVEYLPGWQCDISGARNWEDLPEAARSYVEYVEKAIGCHIGFVSVGAERESLIIR